MRGVVTRTLINGLVHQEPSTYEAAEAIIGRKLDRRRGYAIIRGVVCKVERWSTACSGCTETPEGCMSDRRGVGCSECGYTGRVRGGTFVPVVQDDNPFDGDAA